MPTNCVWLDNVGEEVSDTFLCQAFARFGLVTYEVIDRETSRALVYFENIDISQRAVNEMRGRTIGKNKIPYIVTNDGRTIRFPHPDIELGDSIKLNLSTHEIDGVIKFVNGASVMLTGGNNIGRIGVISSIEKHLGSYDIGNVKDSTGK